MVHATLASPPAAQVLGYCGIRGLIAPTARGLRYGRRPPWLAYCLGLHLGLSDMEHATLASPPAAQVLGYCGIGGLTAPTARGLRYGRRPPWLAYCLGLHLGLSDMVHATLASPPAAQVLGYCGIGGLTAPTARGLRYGRRPPWLAYCLGLHLGLSDMVHATLASPPAAQVLGYCGIGGLTAPTARGLRYGRRPPWLAYCLGLHLGLSDMEHATLASPPAAQVLGYCGIGGLTAPTARGLRYGRRPPWLAYCLGLHLGLSDMEHATLASPPAAQVLGYCGIGGLTAPTARGLRYGRRPPWLAYCLGLHLGLSDMVHATLASPPAAQVLGYCGIGGLTAPTARGLRYGRRPPWLAYCLGLHLGLSVMMHATLKLRRQSPPVTIFYDVRKWCYLAALLSTDHHKIRLLQGLEDFDEKIRDLNRVELIEYNPWKRGFLWHLLYHLIYTVGTNAVSFTFFYPTDKPLLGLVFDLTVKTFAGEMGFVNTIVNVVFSNEFCYRYRLITASWVHHMRRLRDSPVSRAPVQERLRLLHGELTALAALLATCYGRFYLVNLFFVFLESMMFLYRIILVQSQITANVQSVLYLVVNVASVPVLACSTHSVLVASKEIIRELRAMRFAGLPRVCGEQVILFVKQLHRAPLSIAACGFFPINRQLIATMMASMTTYFMVIIQMGEELGVLVGKLFGLG